jgi:hypothetical protein
MIEARMNGFRGIVYVGLNGFDGEVVYFFNHCIEEYLIKNNPNPISNQKFKLNLMHMSFDKRLKLTKILHDLN